jgi:predicted NAD/FAD-dependent oxidoreductase
MWGHALPERQLEETLIIKLELMNLFPNGDCVNNKGRVDDAVLSGLDLYKKLKIKILVRLIVIILK